jgi:hypothetical protein
VLKRFREHAGGWRQNDRKVAYRNQGDPCNAVSCMEVRAFVVAMKFRNGNGAKGGREIDGKNTHRMKGTDSSDCKI